MYHSMILVVRDIMIQIITIIMVAIGLSMDAFSLAILYGTLSFDKKKSLTLSGSVGVFHFFMPLYYENITN